MALPRGGSSGLPRGGGTSLPRGGSASLTRGRGRGIVPSPTSSGALAGGYFALASPEYRREVALKLRLGLPIGHITGGEVHEIQQDRHPGHGLVDVETGQQARRVRQQRQHRGRRVSATRDDVPLKRVVQGVEPERHLDPEPFEIPQQDPVGAH